ncbi:tigger transposable element-derived protein 1-like isoform X3 [Homarus americanus]|uniref:tigger transposable element-derived protein 1-like isoform X3 n=1 Tax=Homarus americanus TaxID=6706 RepID=UPI001C4443E0|nr:tigger transposable element-derived protein 1-like isoform X3 [Homarus americanus]
MADVDLVSRGATKHCCYGVCNSDSRYAHRKHMKNVKWIPFPGPEEEADKCKRWIRACGRENFTVEKVNKLTNICSKHFVGGNGPTEAHPDPIPAQYTPDQLRNKSKKRKIPTRRELPSSKRIQSDVESGQLSSQSSEPLSKKLHVTVDEAASKLPAEEHLGNVVTNAATSTSMFHQTPGVVMEEALGVKEESISSLDASLDSHNGSRGSWDTERNLPQSNTHSSLTPFTNGIKQEDIKFEVEVTQEFIVEEEADTVAQDPVVKEEKELEFIDVDKVRIEDEHVAPEVDGLSCVTTPVTSSSSQPDHPSSRKATKTNAAASSASSLGPKCSATSPSGSSSKKQRKSIDLEEKLKIIRQRDGGKSVNAIARDFGMSHSTITTIMKKREKILEAVKGSASMKATRLTKFREGPISNMEKMLVTWIEDQTQKRVPLGTLTITAKAKSLFEMLKQQAGADYDKEFSASSGWFKRFKHRYGLHNLKVSGESASADSTAAAEFINTLDKLIVKGGYLPQQIINMDETSLFWKRMPERSFIHKEAKSMPGFKAFKDRVTVMLGGSVTGFKLKPFVVWHSENPKAFKNINKHTLPVYYRANQKSWMTQALFQDALLNCYAGDLEKYCIEEGIEFKILLILDNALGHPPFIGDLHPNIKVVFLPPNTTSLIQPMDQGAIAAFKSYYLRRTFAMAISATEDDEKTLKEFWKEYNMYHCIKNIAWAWDDVTKHCMNGVWKKVLKRYVNHFRGFETVTELEKIMTNLVKMANKLNLGVDDDDIEELLEVVPEELTNEELLELQQHWIAEEEAREKESEEEEVVVEEKKFTVKGLSKFFADLNTLLKSAEEMDPNTERFSLIERNAHAVFAAYRQIYEEKKPLTKQTTLDIFIKKTNSTPRQTLARPFTRNR